tara:strand:- start:4029 stop:8450 length:4422 start_codon:yes stop_codon:yes gene_type:complete
MTKKSNSLSQEDIVEHLWPGLFSYRERDKENFYGRSEEINILLRMVRRETLTTLFGRSGTGKTSLLNAGLFPKIRELAYLPVYIRLNHNSDGHSSNKHGYTNQIIDAVKEAAESQHLELESICEPISENETLWEFFHRHELWDQNNELLVPILSFDQFEELFTLGNQTEQAAELITELGNLIENHIPESVSKQLDQDNLKIPFVYDQRKFKVIFSLREDYVHRLDELQSQIPSIMKNRFALNLMEAKNGLEAILGPGSHIVDKDTAEEIIDFVTGRNQPGSTNIVVEPSLLSVVCRELNMTRLDKKAEKITTNQFKKSKTDILDSFYLRSFEGLEKEVKQFVEDELITNSGIRKTVPIEEAKSAATKGLTSIDKLVNRRLLRTEYRLGNPHIELSHDLLTQVALKNRNQRIGLQQQKQQRRKMVMVIAASIVVTFIMTMFTIYNHNQLEQIKRAESKANDALIAAEKSLALSLKAQGDNYYDKSDFTKAALHYAASLKLADTISARNKLGTLLSLTPQAEWEASVFSYSEFGAKASEDGSVIAFGDSTDGILILESDSKSPLSWIQTGNSISSIAFVSNNEIIAAGSDEVYLLKRSTPGNWQFKQIANHPSNSSIRSVAKDKEGQVAFGDYSGNLYVFNSDKDEDIPKLIENSAGHTLRYLQFDDNNQLIGVGDDRDLMVWSDNFKTLTRYSGHSQRVRLLRKSSEGIISAGKREIIEWDDNFNVNQKYRLPRNKVLFSFDTHDDFYAAGTDSGEVLIWKKDDDKIFKTITLSKTMITNVIFSEMNQSLLSTDQYGQLWRININSWEIEKVKDVPSKARNALAVNPGKMLFIADGSLIKQYKLPSHQLVANLDSHNSNVKTLSYNVDSNLLASSDFDKTVRIWDLKEATVKHILRDFNQDVSSLAFISESLLVAGDMQGNLSLWDVAQGIKLKQLNLDGDVITSLETLWQPKRLKQWQQKTPLIFIASRDGLVRVLDGQTLEIIAQLTWQDDIESIEKISLSIEDRRFIIGGANGDICVYRLDQDSEIFKNNCFNKPASKITGLTWVASGWAASDDNGHLILSPTNKNNPPVVHKLHNSAIKAITWDTKSKLLYSVSTDKRIKSWQLPREQTKLPVIPNYSGDLWQTELLDGDLIIAGGKNLQRVLKVSSAGNDKDLIQADGLSQSEFYAVKVSNDSKSFAIGGQRGMLYFGRKVDETDESDVSIFSDESTSTFRTSSGTLYKKSLYEGHSYYVSYLDYTPDSSILLSADSSGRIIKWDTESMTQKGAFQEHSTNIKGVTSCSDNTHVISADDAGNIYTWNINTNEIINELFIPEKIASLDLSPNNKHLAIGTTSNSTLIWSLEQCKPMQQLWKSIQDENFVGNVKFTQDSRALISTAGGKWRMFDVESGDIINENLVAGTDQILKVSVFDNQFLLTGKNGFNEIINSPIALSDITNIDAKVQSTYGVKLTDQKISKIQPKFINPLLSGDVDE